MNVLQHTRNELNLCLKQNRPDRSYRDTLLSISFLQDGLEKSTPDPVGHHHCFLLITIYEFKKNKMKYLSISFIQDGLEESTPGPVGPHH